MYPKVYYGLVENLMSKEVFVFHSNLSGFHGAGAAGFASFGVAGNHWRKYHYEAKPIGWKGRWNVKGAHSGYQEGSSGNSYAIPTVVKPGSEDTIPITEIRKSIEELFRFTNQRKDLIFYIAQTDKSGYSGYSPKEFIEVYFSCWKESGGGDNVYFNNKLVEKYYK